MILREWSGKNWSACVRRWGEGPLYEAEIRMLMPEHPGLPEFPGVMRVVSHTELIWVMNGISESDALERLKELARGYHTPLTEFLEAASEKR